MASNNTVRVVTYSDWWTKDGVVSKTVSLLVTPKVVVRKCYALFHDNESCIVSYYRKQEGFILIVVH